MKYDLAISFAHAFLFFISSLGIRDGLPQAGVNPFISSLPVPGAMVNLTQAFRPVLIKGLKVDRGDPFKFNFVIAEGDGRSGVAKLKEEISDVVRYFLTALTVPEGDLWVNLSPYEKDRIIPDELAQTDMGEGLLAQDYILKQLSSSLTYPESELGKKFWQKVYQRAQQVYGTTKLPFDTFNKIWIVPSDADIYVDNDKAFCTNVKLKVSKGNLVVP